MVSPPLVSPFLTLSLSNVPNKPLLAAAHGARPLRQAPQTRGLASPPSSSTARCELQHKPEAPQARSGRRLLICRPGPLFDLFFVPVDGGGDGLLVQLLRAFAGRHPGCKSCLQLLLAIRSSRPVLQRPPALLQTVAGDATVDRRCCYNGAPALLQNPDDSATEGCRRCYLPSAPSTLLQFRPPSATMAGRCCCKAAAAGRRCCKRRCCRHSLTLLQAPKAAAT